MSVRHLNPYRETAVQYRDKFWAGVLPIPYREKHPPPTGFTGHAAPYPTTDQIQQWCDDGNRYNICLRLAGVSKEFEVIGIDVDHYVSGGKEKRGGDQLDALEVRLGVLPETWISSARTDGVSGIRYFRVPRGLAFRGKIDKDIECIQKGHRFAVVWPSKHPDGGTYRWFAPGAPLSLEGLGPVAEIPDARELPELPESWLKYLTQDKMSASDLERIDMDSSVDEIYKWAEATFHGEDDTDMCSTMRNKLEHHKKSIEDGATSHDKIVNAHYNLLSLASEGHLGWVRAVNEVEQFWTDDVIARDKRSRDEIIQEVWRSRTNALRKIKARIDGRVAVNAAPVDQRCDKTGRCVDKGQSIDAVLTAMSGAKNGTDGGDPLRDIPRRPAQDPDQYEMNDDGNAQHFVDMFSSIDIGPSVRYAEGYGWIVWHTGEHGRGIPHWERDQIGNQEMRRMWQRVKDAQNVFATQLKMNLDNLIAQALQNPPPAIPPGQPSLADQIKIAKAIYEKWRRFSEVSGNNRNAVNALEAVQSVSGVSIDVNTLDANRNLLGVANGVLELDIDNVRIRDARPEDYITMNTNVPWEKPSDFAADKWQDYLNTFLPDPDLQKAVQINLGHCLIGGNPEKILIVLKGGTNTGKSTLVSVLKNALGDYAMTVNPTVFQSHKFNAVLVDALPKRIIMCSEFEESDNLSAAMIKRITGGEDEISVELKNANAKITGTPQFVGILPTNDAPTIEGADEALNNRLQVIPFNVTPAKIDKDAAGIVRQHCKVAVLNWLIEGYVEYRRLGFLPATSEMENSKAEFTAELDEVSDFAREVLQSHSDRKRIHHTNIPDDWCVQSGNMYARFELWWRDNKMPEYSKPSIRKFSRRMKALGYQVIQKRVGGDNGKFWVGVKIKSRIDRDVIPMGQSMGNVVSQLKGNSGAD